MKTLQLDRSYLVLRLKATTPQNGTLTEQVAPFVGPADRIILDVDGIQFNSMLIGELVNVHRLLEAEKRSGHRIALINLTGASRTAMERVRLTEIFELADSIGEAVQTKPPGPAALAGGD
jgi:anti-anti-sigma regulatory factor